jgi:hypothetical protein
MNRELRAIIELMQKMKTNKENWLSHSGTRNFSDLDANKKEQRELHSTHKIQQKV